MDPGYPAGGAQYDVTSFEANQYVRYRCDQPGYIPQPAVIQCVFIGDGTVNWNDTSAPTCIGKGLFAKSFFFISTKTFINKRGVPSD